MQLMLLLSVIVVFYNQMTTHKSPIISVPINHPVSHKLNLRRATRAWFATLFLTLSNNKAQIIKIHNKIKQFPLKWIRINLFTIAIYLGPLSGQQFVYLLLPHHRSIQSLKGSRRNQNLLSLIFMMVKYSHTKHLYLVYF